MSIDGMDISGWQTVTPSLTGKAFLFVKASEGTWLDPMYVRHVANGRAASLAMVGAYAFNRSDVDMAAQVAAFAKASSGADAHALDVEPTTDSASGTTIPAFTLAQATDFIARWHALTGKRIGLYMSRSVFFDAGQDWNWVADWGSVPPVMPWTFWQRQGSPLDLDTFNGTADQLRAFVAAQGGTMFPVVIEMPFPEAAPGRKFVIAAGTTLNGYDPARPGQIVLSQKFATDSSAHATHRVGVTWYDSAGVVIPTANAPVPKSFPFLLVADGPYKGMLIVEAMVKLDPAPADTTPFSQAAVDAAKAAGLAEGRADEYATWVAWITKQPVKP